MHDGINSHNLGEPHRSLQFSLFKVPRTEKPNIMLS